MARNIPTVPSRLPRRALSGWLSPLRLMMNRRLARTYVALAKVVVTARLLLPEHLQHAVGDEEAARDVDRGDEHRDRAEPLRDSEGGADGEEHAADDDDPRDGVGHAHQR